MTRLSRSLALLALALGLAAPAAQAQGPAPGEESSGNPLYGYLGTAALGAGIIFILCKSSRR